MYKRAKSVAHVPTLVVALNQECSHQAWWDVRFLEPHKLVHESRVPLCDVGFEFEGEVFVVALILVVSTSNVWGTCGGKARLEHLRELRLLLRGSLICSNIKRSVIFLKKTIVA